MAKFSLDPEEENANIWYSYSDLSKKITVDWRPAVKDYLQYAASLAKNGRMVDGLYLLLKEKVFE